MGIVIDLIGVCGESVCIVLLCMRMLVNWEVSYRKLINMPAVCAS